jgi:hypothetical protein
LAALSEAAPRLAGLPLRWVETCAISRNICGDFPLVSLPLVKSPHPCQMSAPGAPTVDKAIWQIGTEMGTLAKNEQIFEVRQSCMEGLDVTEGKRMVAG